MVDAVVSSVMLRLGDLLIEQVDFLKGVKDEVQNLRKQLDYMLAFLKYAEEKQDEDPSIRIWVSDIRDAAYDAEDIIDKHIIKVQEGRNPTKVGLIACLRKYFCICKQANLYGIGKEIKELKNRLDKIYEFQKKFESRKNEAAEEVSRISKKFKVLRRTTPNEDNEYVVGFEKDVNLLTSKLLEETLLRSVISIVGMGGMGKTTLARKLYNSDSVKKNFDCRAWVYVSNDYNIQDLLRKIIKIFNAPKSKKEFDMLNNMKEEALETHLRDFLAKSRYFLVIDDVWDTDAWVGLKNALPENNKGSRVIITTRNKVIAESASGNKKYVHELQFLQEKESLEFLREKVFSTYDGVNDITSHRPSSLDELAINMVRKCHGLPLAIVVLCELLSRKDLDEWPKLKDNIWQHVSADDIEKRGSALVPQILALSFNDLPHHLKSCFLYLGLFPEGFKIDVETLLRLWVAEGFVCQQGQETLEETAAKYLNELIDRNLILIEERKWKRIRRCRVHELFRDFAIKKSMELNFIHIYDGNVYSTISPKSRRLAYHIGGLDRFDSFQHSSNLPLRTLLSFNLGNEFTKMAESQLYTKLRMLRVLYMENTMFTPSQQIEHVRLPDEIQMLIHLRYLGLKGTKINVFPSSIGNFLALQTLECSMYDFPILLPNEKCNAKQLRHLIGYFKWPFRVENLTNLQTLNYVKVDDKMEFNPSRDLINLRELQIIFNGESKGFSLDSIGRLKNLQTLLLNEFKHTGWFPTLQPLSHCQHLLQLKLYGKIVKLLPEMHEFLPNLKYLLLDGSGMKEDPMPSLEKLPKLTILDLSGYSGEKLACTIGGFPQLEILQLWNVYVKEFRVDEGAMPVLRGLNVGDDVSIPERLRSIPLPKNWGNPNDNNWPY